MSKQLTKDHKVSRLILASEQLEHSNGDEGTFFNCFITGDELWVHNTEPETKSVKVVDTILFPSSQSYAGCIGFSSAYSQKKVCHPLVPPPVFSILPPNQYSKPAVPMYYVRVLKEKST